ncbi:fumarylacetoacetate hydrolase family protein [Bacillus fonticola]|uniref:fumarylacetoacetate hydrolase family protein n=1 Tax=Bacillus fonticola TaxID=2728853 RepID=UPI00147376EF|nr:fumarylacetoacetate hydrolase family protein [Bacillus fonticola]
MNIQTIYAVGRNYAKHAQELGNDIPSEPLLFHKPASAAVYAEGQTIPLPFDKGEVHFETELVLRIGKRPSQGATVDELISHITVGLDLTLRDVQSELKKNGHPWLRAKGFRNSAVLGAWQPWMGYESFKSQPFSLEKNGHQTQHGTPSEMMFSVERLLAELDEWFGLAEGDLLFTGTPEGVGPLVSGDKLNLLLGDQDVGRITIG